MKQILSYRLLLFGLAIITFLLACNSTGGSKRVLVFSKTAGFRHESIEAGVELIKNLGEKNSFEVVHTEDASIFTEEKLKDFNAVVFLNTTGDILNAEQQADFERFIQAGGGFVGVHAAADTEYDWAWYGKLVGAYFNGHPNNPNVRDASITVLDHNHISTKMLPEKWDRTDEWYNYKSINSAIHKLLNLDETTYEGGTNGADHPIAWYHEFDGGRAFYTGGGHTNESYAEPLFQQHLLGGLKWVMDGKKKDYSLATTKRVPPEDRFVQTVMAQNLAEPTELDIFPDGRVIVVERRGGIKVYDPKRETIEQVALLPVHTKFEDGLMGVTIDPNYKDNHWIYMYYSPVDKSVNRLSRFVFKDSLELASEKIMLEVVTQRDECCHTGGSLAFGSDGLLYLSTGDNTNPFASDGFAPIDERPGRSAWDAQRSSGNTNDLRGKVLRIKPEADGTYSIPKGNLFPEGMEKTRPEIYVMGLRNPYRISIDHKRNWLYWGDVGPDAGKTDSLRGPKGFDALNQAREAGNYGWPYFRGNTYTYGNYDFATGTYGPAFDPKKPINESPNNTGLRELPPYQPSLIWYSYDESQEFPWVKTGGKNPMAGPIYYQDMFKGVENRFPDYFEGTVLFYEWMRNFIYVVHLDSAGNFLKADPFLPSTQFSRPMDMAFGPDGALYILEYGEQWFAQNFDARLSKIEYIKGNRRPQAKILASTDVGGLPLTVNFSAKESVDFDKDKLQYKWKFPTETLTGEEVSYTFTKPGKFWVELEAKDPSGGRSTAKKLIQVGNAVPEIAWTIDKGNQTFYWDNATIDYSVEVTDAEDGSLSAGTINPGWVTVSINYLTEGEDITEIAQGHQMNPGTVPASSGEFAAGLKVIEDSDCKACHAINKKVNGPSYIDVAYRYRGDAGAVERLAAKVIKGGAGNWGETVMSAHPQLSEAQAREAVQYILSLSPKEQSGSSLPPSGSYTTREHIGKAEGGKYILMASYQDKGNAGIGPITSQKRYTLRSPKVPATAYSLSSSKLMEYGGMVILGNNDYFGFKGIDMTGVKEITVMIGTQGAAPGKPELEIHLDKPDGQLLGKTSFSDASGGKEFSFTITEATGKHDVYVVMRNADFPSGPFAGVGWVYFGNGSQFITQK